MSITRSKRASTTGYVYLGRGAKSRTCPQCQAKPAFGCGYWSVGYWHPIKSFHKGR